MKTFIKDSNTVGDKKNGQIMLSLGNTNKQCRSTDV